MDRVVMERAGEGACLILQTNIFQF